MKVSDSSPCTALLDGDCGWGSGVSVPAAISAMWCATAWQGEDCREGAVGSFALQLQLPCGGVLQHSPGGAGGGGMQEEGLRVSSPIAAQARLLCAAAWQGGNRGRARGSLPTAAPSRPYCIVDIWTNHAKSGNLQFPLTTERTERR